MGYGGFAPSSPATDAPNNQDTPGEFLNPVEFPIDPPTVDDDGDVTTDTSEA